MSPKLRPWWLDYSADPYLSDVNEFIGESGENTGSCLSNVHLGVVI